MEGVDGEVEGGVMLLIAMDRPQGAVDRREAINMARLFNLQVVKATLIGGSSSLLYSDPELNGTLGTADTLFTQIYVDGVASSATDVTVDLEGSNDGITWNPSPPKVVLLDTLGDNKISSAVRPFGEVHWNHPIGVWFNEEFESWTIVNMDLAPMEPGLLFNVANISAIHGSGVTQHYGTVVSTGRTGSVQSFCLSPCDASPAFSVTVNMSWRYQTDLLQGGMSRESLLGSVVQRVIPARRCRSPLAVGVDQQLYPVFPRRHGRFEERTFLIYSDRLSIPEGVGFSVYHLGSA